MLTLDVRLSESVILSIGDKQRRALFRKVGNEVAAVARSKLRHATAAGKKRTASGGVYTASAPGEPPNDLTGRLAKSIQVHPYKSGQGVAIRASAFYAKFLELGAVGGGGRLGSRNTRRRGVIVATHTARVLLARPFMGAALAERGGSLAGRIKDAFLADVAFKRQGAGRT
ncbi:MAG: hypothetical protein NVSMB20_10420 [Bradyrhizobium sp.]